MYTVLYIYTYIHTLYIYIYIYIHTLYIYIYIEYTQVFSLDLGSVEKSSLHLWEVDDRVRSAVSSLRFL
jgi:hypothetical protein